MLGVGSLYFPHLFVLMILFAPEALRSLVFELLEFDMIRQKDTFSSSRV